MIGTLAALELSRSARDRRMWFARWVYAGWLVVVLYFHHASYFSFVVLPGLSGGFAAGSTSKFAHDLVDFLVWQQTILLILIAPSFAAGAVTDEKVRGTLEALFLASMSPASVILGKLLARIAQGFMWSLAAWPVISMVGLAGGVAPIFFAALAAVTLLALGGICAFSMLASVWARTSRDAMVAAYVILSAVAVLVARTPVNGPLEVLAALNPNYVLDTARDRPDYAVLGHRLGMATLSWGTIAIVCTTVAVWRLRPAYIRQLAKRKPRFLSRVYLRPRIGDRPIAWKEQFLGRLPQWWGWLLCAIIWTAVAWIVVTMSPTVAIARSTIHNLSWCIVGVLSLTAGVRASATIVGERDRQTWDNLITVPDSFDNIVRDKLTGIINGLWPFWFATAVPIGFVMSVATMTVQTNFELNLAIYVAVIVLALLAVVVLLRAGFAWVPTCWYVIGLGVAIHSGRYLFEVIVCTLYVAVSMRLMAAVGIWVSARSRSAWMSLLATVVLGYATAAVLIVASTPLCCTSGCVFVSLMASAGPFNDSMIVGSAFMVGSTIALAWGASIFATRAAAYLARHDRVPDSYARSIQRWNEQRIEALPRPEVIQLSEPEA